MFFGLLVLVAYLLAAIAVAAIVAAVSVAGIVHAALFGACDNATLINLRLVMLLQSPLLHTHNFIFRRQLFVMLHCYHTQMWYR